MMLDGIGDAIHAGLEISRWSLLYYASWVLLASFVFVNVLIGVVLTSLDEARVMEGGEEEAPAARRPAPDRTDQQHLRRRIEAARRALDDLERDLATRAAPLRLMKRVLDGTRPRTRTGEAGDRRLAPPAGPLCPPCRRPGGGEHNGRPARAGRSWADRVVGQVPRLRKHPHQGCLTRGGTRRRHEQGHAPATQTGSIRHQRDGSLPAIA